MAAPTGVNGGAPQEPAEPKPARSGPAEPRPAQARLAEPGPAQVAAAEAAPSAAVPPPARPAEAELAEAKPAEAEPAQGATGDAADLAEAGPAEAGGQVPEAGEESRHVGWLAAAGIVLGIVALAAAAAAALAVITHGFGPKTVVTYRPASVFGLRPGDCVNTAPNGLSVTVVSCAVAHDVEVFGKFSLPASAWPGAAAVEQAAAAGCAGLLGRYLNPAFAGAALAQEYVYPDRAAWLAGERTVVCEVRADSGQLTGSVGKGG